MSAIDNQQAVVLEDDEALASAYEKLLSSLGYQVRVAHRISQARAFIRDRSPDLILLDVNLPDGNGLDLMDELRNDTRGRFVVISGDGSQRAAIKSIRHRAVEHLVKPVTLAQLKTVLQLPGDVSSRASLCWINAGDCQELNSLRQAISVAAERLRGHALIMGQPGVEKPAVAFELHRRSRRAGKFIMVDCSAEQGTAGLIRLFGKEDPSKNAVVSRGLIEQAAGGTLVLDYVEQLPVEAQSKLTRVLDSGYYKRLYAQSASQSNVAVVAIARKSNTHDVDETSLRTEFLFRLAEVTLKVPNLKQCQTSIAEIAQALLSDVARRDSRQLAFDSTAITTISKRAWPGNVRELRSAISRAVARADPDQAIDMDVAASAQSDDSGGGFIHGTAEDQIAPWVGKTIWEMERQLLLATLSHFDGDKHLTAKTLSISLKTLYNRMNALGAHP